MFVNALYTLPFIQELAYSVNIEIFVWRIRLLYLIKFVMGSEVASIAAAQNLFKSRRPRNGICCPVHDRVVCVKYVQPPRPQSCKPERHYVEPEHCLSADTIYHLSYREIDAKEARECRPPAAVIRTNIATQCGKLEDNTTMGLSYLWNCQPPPEPFRPKPLLKIPCGPMQEMTTQRHDFIPKPSLRSDKIIPHGNIGPICGKMEDRTVAMESYLPVGRPDPPKSCKPIHLYEGPQCPLANTTVTQLSYQPPELPCRDMPPWMLRREYQMPDCAMAGDTIYNGSYLPPGNFEPCDGHEVPQEDVACWCKFVTASEDL